MSDDVRCADIPLLDSPPVVHSAEFDWTNRALGFSRLHKLLN